MKLASVPQSSLAVRYGSDPASLQRGFANHLKYDLVEDRFTATTHDHYLALALTVRDRLIKGWGVTQQTHHHHGVKRVYYMSLEFLMGRALSNNIINLDLGDSIRAGLKELRIDLEELCLEETDAGLGNGGLGRLAACFLDSLATLEIPAIGYGIRYDYGIFRQRLDNGYQIEEPDDWLRGGNPWEIPRPDYRILVNFGGRVETVKEAGQTVSRWVDTEPVIGFPYDMPIVGYRSGTVNTLRLWSARGTEEFNFGDFNQGDYIGAVEHNVQAENLTKVLYPNDELYVGKELRMRQQYFFVACSLFDILRRFKHHNDDWDKFPDHAAIQLNDTHPALAVPELMRLLVDEEGVSWDRAWDLTVRTFGYTNHTLLPEALETWPVSMIERLLPRHLQIIYRINQEFLGNVRRCFPGDARRVGRMSLIGEASERCIRMAHLSIVGSHSTNGVARLHTELLRRRVVPDFAEMFPERFNSKTNGVTPRRWLLKCNPDLAALITDTIGEVWVNDLERLRQLEPFAKESAFRQSFHAVKQENKKRLAAYMRAELGFEADPDTLFDVQVKRLHEYKRQLLNALHIVVLYNRLLQDPKRDIVPRTFIFAGKAAPGYYLAKLIIKFISNLGQVINNDPVVDGRLKVFFLPDYGVSLAERIIPAADISEQISTAGKEASGTGNMKLMMNGALTIGTLDGANVEIMEEVGEDNIFIFGLTAEEVAARQPEYDPAWHYDNDPETHAAIDLIAAGAFSPGEPRVFDPLRRTLLEDGDAYLHLADLTSYCQAQQQVADAYRDPEDWSRKAILNVAASGKFSSDRTILEYAREIWQTPPFPIKRSGRLDDTISMARADLQSLDPPPRPAEPDDLDAPDEA